MLPFPLRRRAMSGCDTRLCPPLIPPFRFGRGAGASALGELCSELSPPAGRGRRYRAPRVQFQVRWLMAVVALVAANCVALRVFYVTSHRSPSLVVMELLPMLDLLLPGTVFAARQLGRRGDMPWLPSRVRSIRVGRRRHLHDQLLVSRCVRYPRRVPLCGPGSLGAASRYVGPDLQSRFVVLEGLLNGRRHGSPVAPVIGHGPARRMPSLGVRSHTRPKWQTCRNRNRSGSGDLNLAASVGPVQHACSVTARL